MGITIFSTYMYKTELFEGARKIIVQIGDSKVPVYKHPFFSNVYALEILKSPQERAAYIPFLCNLAHELKPDCQYINLIIHDNDLIESFNQGKDWIFWDNEDMGEDICLITFKHTQSPIVDIISNSELFKRNSRNEGFCLHTYIRELVDNGEKYI